MSRRRAQAPGDAPIRGCFRFFALAAALLLLHPLLTGPAASLQAQASRPLPPAHWSPDLLEALRAVGVPGGELLMARGISGAGAMAALETALEGARASGPGARAPGEGAPGRSAEALLLTWTRRLEAEVGRPGSPFLAELEGGWSDRPALPFRARGGYGRVLLAADPTPEVTIWGEVLVSSDGGGEALRSGGLALPLGSFDLFVGRQPVALGQGRSSFILNGRVPMDGAVLTSRTPFRLPASLEGLGEFRLHAGISPFISTPEAPSAWFGSFGLAWTPHPRVDLGVLRTTRFAGEGLDPFSVGDFLRMLAWQGENDSFDDSQGEVAARVRWSLGGQSLVTYLSLGFEDKSSVTEDPGLLLGGLLPLLRNEALYTLRYEFQAFGSRAYWCGGCKKDHHAWYLSPSFGAYVLDGEPLGSELGGYGASHRARLDAWLTELPLRTWAEYFRGSRYFRNILTDAQVREKLAPESFESWSLGMDLLLGGRWGLSGSLQTATLDGERTMGGSAAIRYLPGG